MRTQYLVRRAVITGAAVVSLGAMVDESAIAQQCPPGAYEVSRTETATEVQIICDCLSTFKLVSGVCKKIVPPMPAGAIEKAVPIVAARVVGDVEFFIQVGTRRYPIAPRGAFKATAVRTGRNSRATLLFADGSAMVIGENSEFALDEFVYSEAKLSAPSATKIVFAGAVRGLVRYIGSAAAALGWKKRPPRKPRRGRVDQIPRHVIVENAFNRGFDLKLKRQIDFLVEFDKSGALAVKMIEGELGLASVKNGEKIKLRAGDQIKIGADGKLGPSRRLAPKKVIIKWRRRLKVNLPRTSR